MAFIVGYTDGYCFDTEEEGTYGRLDINAFPRVSHNSSEGGLWVTSSDGTPYYVQRLYYSPSTSRDDLVEIYPLNSGNINISCYSDVNMTNEITDSSPLDSEATVFYIYASITEQGCYAIEGLPSNCYFYNSLTGYGDAAEYEYSNGIYTVYPDSMSYCRVEISANETSVARNITISGYGAEYTTGEILSTWSFTQNGTSGSGGGSGDYDGTYNVTLVVTGLPSGVLFNDIKDGTVYITSGGSDYIGISVGDTNVTIATGASYSLIIPLKDSTSELNDNNFEISAMTSTPSGKINTDNYQYTISNLKFTEDTEITLDFSDCVTTPVVTETSQVTFDISDVAGDGYSSDASLNVDGSSWGNFDSYGLITVDLTQTEHEIQVCFSSDSGLANEIINYNGTSVTVNENNQCTFNISVSEDITYTFSLVSHESTTVTAIFQLCDDLSEGYNFSLSYGNNSQAFSEGMCELELPIGDNITCTLNFNQLFTDELYLLDSTKENIVGEIIFGQTSYDASITIDNVSEDSRDFIISLYKPGYDI